MCSFSNDTATTPIYTLSLHDALPISARDAAREFRPAPGQGLRTPRRAIARSPATRCAGNALAGSLQRRDRKSTRLNSSHVSISYAVFCLKKKTLQRGRDTANDRDAHV